MTYALECNSVNTLLHKGWTQGCVEKGDQITVGAYGAKVPRPLADGSIHANARSIKKTDGYTVSAGTSANDDAQEIVLPSGALKSGIAGSTANSTLRDDYTHRFR